MAVAAGSPDAPASVHWCWVERVHTLIANPLNKTSSGKRAKHSSAQEGLPWPNPGDLAGSAKGSG